MSNDKKAIGVKEGGKPTLVPKLRFPEFRDQALLLVELRDVTAESTLRNGKRLPASVVMGVSKANGIVPMDDRIVASDIGRYKVVRKDWFAYNPMRLNIGSIARWQGDTDVLVSPDYIVFSCLNEQEPGLHSAFLDQFRQSAAWENFVTQGGGGSVRIRIYYDDIGILKLILPVLAEQQKIAECLTSLDEAIAAQASKVDALKAHKKALMQQLFPRKGKTQPRMRFPAFRAAEAWRSYLLEELEELGWLTLGRGNVISNQDIKAIPGEYPIYSSSVRNDGYMGSYGRFMFDEELISWSIDGGGDFFYRPRHKFSVTNVSGFLRIDTRQMNYHFMASQLQALHASFVFDYQFKAHPSVIRKLYRLSLPSLVEQQRIAKCLSSLDTLIAAESQKRDMLRSHKKGLMQQLFLSRAEDNA